MKIVPFLIVLGLISCASHDKDEGEVVPSKAISDIHSPQDKVTGMVTIDEMEDHFLVKALVTGLKPNSKHGFHIHENGVCEGPDFKSAGGHLNPYDKPHGAPKEEKSHLGDLGNLVANKKGVAKKDLKIDKEHEESMKKILGRAMIIHAEADDLTSQPSGDAGGRIACGIIKPVI